MGIRCNEAKVVWIAGGLDKGNDYAAIEALVVQKVSALICLGVDNQKLLKSFTKIVPLIKDTHSIQDAVRIAFEIAKRRSRFVIAWLCKF